MKKLLLSLMLLAAVQFQSDAQDKFTNVKVTSVKINKVPLERLNGTPFDADGYPDIYATFNVHNESWYTTNYYEHSCMYPLTFDLVRPFKVENLDIPYTLNIMDLDRYGDDEVVQIFKDIVFANYKDYPSEIVLKYQDRAEVVLSVKWY